MHDRRPPPPPDADAPPEPPPPAGPPPGIFERFPSGELHEWTAEDDLAAEKSVARDIADVRAKWHLAAVWPEAARALRTAGKAKQLIPPADPDLMLPSELGRLLGIERRDVKKTAEAMGIRVALRLSRKRLYYSRPDYLAWKAAALAEPTLHPVESQHEAEGAATGGGNDRRGAATQKAAARAHAGRVRGAPRDEPEHGVPLGGGPSRRKRAGRPLGSHRRRNRP